MVVLLGGLDLLGGLGGCGCDAVTILANSGVDDVTHGDFGDTLVREANCLVVEELLQFRIESECGEGITGGHGWFWR